METDCKQVEVTGSIGTEEYVLRQISKESRPLECVCLFPYSCV